MRWGPIHSRLPGVAPASGKGLPEMTTAAAGALAGLEGVHRRFGKIEALRGVDLRLHPGELVALLGPNRTRP
jgi:ABC-type polysaccharide/polyol phosphate transport system ATPase subunit